MTIHATEHVLADLIRDVPGVTLAHSINSDNLLITDSFSHDMILAFTPGGQVIGNTDRFLRMLQDMREAARHTVR